MSGGEKKNNVDRSNVLSNHCCCDNSEISPSSTNSEDSHITRRTRVEIQLGFCGFHTSAKECTACTDMAGHLDESQRLFSAADQSGLLLLLLLHNGGEGHGGVQGRAAHWSQHPRPDVDRHYRGTAEHTQSEQMLQRKCLDSFPNSWII